MLRVPADRLSLEAWSGLWERLGAGADPRPVHRAVLRAYTEPHRHYHTLEHIARVLGLFDAVRERCRQPDEAELALWVHDLVYDPGAADNEERSATLARRWLVDGGVAEPRTQHVATLILATRHRAPPDDDDARYVVDIDLSILGAPQGEFDRYERQVRQEYAVRSDEEWRERRAALLRVFLERPRIYQTLELAVLEAPARANLVRSLARLTASPRG